MNLLKHIVLSNIIMLILPLIALKLDLFSNQVNLLYQQQIDTFIQLNTNIANLQASQLTLINRMPLHSRYILSHCQFDGIHFITNFYNHQSNFAFIKGYTSFIQVVKQVVKKIFKKIKIETTSFHLSSFETQIIVLVLINKILFSLSAIKLQAIAFHLTNDQQNSYLIAKLFLYNPSSIFFHALYTESIYTFLTFTAILKLFKSQSKFNPYYLMAVGYLSLAVFFRTNAIFMAPIFGIPIIFQLWLKITQKKWMSSIILILKGFVILLFILMPLFWYHYFAYSEICSSSTDLLEDKQLESQCQKTLPNLYNFIQHKFWSVGFLSYWKSSNTIFILLGLPSILISLSSTKFLLKDLLSLHKKESLQNGNTKTIRIGLNLSYVILLIVIVTLTNIQSSTRFLSSHVVFYMILGQKVELRMIRLWIGMYLTVGAILYCIGFPWT